MLNEIIELKHEDGGFVPTLTTYILNGEKKRGAVLICPGGGYHFTSPREAEAIAIKFNAAGFHAFVVNYRVAPSVYPKALADVSQAVCLIRKNAEEWHIDRDRVAVCGFSAGGHLAASLAVHYNKISQNNDNKPNALILCYPVITSGEFAHKGSFNNLLGEIKSDELLYENSLEHHVTSETPPTFLWHTFEDKSVPVENSLLFANALRKHNVPFELHIFPYGGHGLSLATEETATGEHHIVPHVAVWTNLCINWLKLYF